MKHFWVSNAAAAAFSLVLCACGGGGGGGSPASISLSPTTISVTDQTYSSGAAHNQTPFSTITVTNPPGDGLFVALNTTTNGVASASFQPTDNTHGQVLISMKDPNQAGVGTYDDTVTVHVCYDDACKLEAKGSPATVSVHYVVTDGTSGSPPPTTEPQPEAGVTAAPLINVQTLAHDVIDAEYSHALDSIVMVSSYPSNALYLYSVANGTEKHAALNKAPTAVSVSPDGLSAAVGHDALISIVNLSTLAQSGTATPKLLNVSANVFDIVLAGNGYVHAFPLVDQWVQIHSVNIATNVETLSSGNSIREKTRAKLHPSGIGIYGVTNGLSPDNIEKYDNSTGPANYGYASPYWGTYPVCGNLWMSETGINIYTACGTVFRSSSVQNQDMVYNGTLALSTAQTGKFQIYSLDQSASQKEIALLEHDWYVCDGYGDPKTCYTHLNLYESDFLNLTAKYSLAPITVAGHAYSQYGLFVFHATNGTKYVITRLYGMPNPDAEYYLSQLN